jgi:hypothetical protein
MTYSDQRKSPNQLPTVGKKRTAFMYWGFKMELDDTSKVMSGCYRVTSLFYYGFLAKISLIKRFSHKFREHRIPSSEINSKGVDAHVLQIVEKIQQEEV